MGQQPAITFECGMCGDCCSSWNIPVEGEKARTLLSRQWVQGRLNQTRRTLNAIAGTDDLYRIPLTDANECIFLADDRRCLIQANEGAALKPRECQRFPFAAVRLPAGQEANHSGQVVFETSAACKKISEKLLLAFAPITPKLSSASECFGTSAPQKNSLSPHNSSLAEGEKTEDFIFTDESLQGQDWLLNPLELDCLSRLPGQVPVSLWKHADWSAYEAWREELPIIFRADGLSPDAALLHAYQKLKSFPGRWTKLGRTRQPKVNPSASFSRWQSGFLACFFLRKPYRTMSWWQLIWGKRYDDPRLFGLTVPLASRRAVVWDNRHDCLLNAFLFNILNRRLPLSRRQTLVSMVSMAAVALVLVRWYATTLASFRHDNTQESVSVSEMDVSSAIRLTERYYTGHQPYFMAWFNDSPLPEILARWLF